MSAPTGAPRPDDRDHEPAAVWRRVAVQARAEVRAMVRNGEQLLLTLVLPALVLVVLGRTRLVDLGADPLDVVAPGVLALALMSTAFTGQAISTAFDRRAGVLRLLATTPLGRAGLVAGKVLAVLVVEVGQVVVLGGVALALGWRPTGVAGALLAVVLGTAAFVPLALLLAGTLRAEAVLAGANLLWVLLLVGGGVVVPADRLPGALATVAPLLPSGALGDLLRTTLAGGGVPLAPVLVLLVWAALGSAATARTFRWT